METFPWDDIGSPDRIIETQKASVIKSPFEAGYVQRRMRHTAMLKEWEIVWVNMYSSERLALLEFWRSMKGPVTSFYWPFPVDLADIPLADGVESEDALASGYDTVVETGAGEGPTFLCVFIEDTLLAEWDSSHQNLFREVRVKVEQIR